MYKLWHKLFGWDYVYVEFGCKYYLKRVYKAPNGIEFVKLYGSIYKLNNSYRDVIRLT